MREIHAVKITLEFHDNKSENISGEGIGVVALIKFFVPDAALIRWRRLFDSGAYSRAALIRVNTVFWGDNFRSTKAFPNFSAFDSGMMIQYIFLIVIELFKTPSLYQAGFRLQ